MERWIIGVIALAVLAAGCGDPAGEDSGDPGAPPAPPAGDVHRDAVWFEVLAISEEAGSHGEIASALEHGDLQPLWERHRFAGPPPEVNYDEHIVLIVVRAEDACPDELVEMRLAEGMLESTWLRPPGMCAQPLVGTAYAVALHRGDLQERFIVVLRQHDGHGGDIEQEIELPPYDGPSAPAPSPPPRRMSADELDAVFAGHPMRRCDEMPSFATEPIVDGPISDEEEVAESQRRRADFALPSDEATVRRLLEDSAANTAMGFPMTEAEFQELISRNRPEFSGRLNAEYLPEHQDTHAFTLVDQAAGGVVVIGFTGDLDGHRKRLAEAFPDVPIRVVEAPATQQEIQAAQTALHERFRPDTPPRVTGSGAGTAFLQISVVDPSRADLDALAEAVDPAISCIEPELSGLPVD